MAKGESGKIHGILRRQDTTKYRKKSVSLKTNRPICGMSGKN